VTKSHFKIYLKRRLYLYIYIKKNLTDPKLNTFSIFFKMLWFIH